MIADDARSVDGGFGLIEAVVAMAMLVVLALASLPLLLNGLKVSTDNVTRAAATALVERQIENSRLVSAHCADVARIDTDGNWLYAGTDARNITISVDSSISGTCPTAESDYPATLTLAVVARRDDTRAVQSRATTEVLVDAP